VDTLSTVRIFFNPLNAASVEKFTLDPGTKLIDFLQKEYPLGFDGMIRVFVGLDELDLTDLDYEIKDQEQVTMLVLPVGVEITAALLVKSLISAAIGLAISFVINFLFAPSAPKGLGNDDESPVYSISATRNRARPNEPIGAYYGSVVYPPDYASAPSQFFFEGSNDQYVDQLMCLGVGEFNITDIFVGETPISALEPGSVRYWVYPPSLHLEQLGNISADMWNNVKDSDVPYPFWENTFTAPEVQDFSFNDDRNDVVSIPAPFVGSAIAAGPDVNGNYQLGHFTDIDEALDIGVGDTIILAGSTSNNGSFLIGSRTIDELDPTKVTLFLSWNTPQTIVTEDPLNPATTYTLNTTVDEMIAGPYRVQKEGQLIRRVAVDIIFPSGIMNIQGSGDVEAKTIQMEYTTQEIDSAGVPIGAPLVETQSYTYRTRAPVRTTYTTPILPDGFYEVTVRRITPFSSHGRDLEITLWSGLKGFVVLDTTVPAYGPTTLMAVRLKATNGLGAAARARLRVKADRILPVGDSDNPITILKDIWTDPNYGMGRPEAELNLDELDELETLYTDNGVSFNGGWDQRGTGFDAMQNCLSLCGARVIQDNALLTVIQDKVQTVRTAMFSTGNTIRDTISIVYTFDSEFDTDGIKIEYRNPTTFDVEFVTYPVDAIDPETVVLFGSTDSVYAAQFAVYLYQVRALRRKIVSLNTELEGLIPRFGDRIGVSHPMANWGHSGVVIEVIDTVTLKMDGALPWSTGQDYMILRDNQGVPTEKATVSQGATADIVVFDVAFPSWVTGPDLQEPTSFAFGEEYVLIKDFMISSLASQGDNSVKVNGQLYDPTIYDGGPPHMGGV
jgi:hypothetical protein